jgi:hypothetical protein
MDGEVFGRIMAGEDIAAIKADQTKRSAAAPRRRRSAGRRRSGCASRRRPDLRVSAVNPADGRRSEASAVDAADRQVREIKK